MARACYQLVDSVCSVRRAKAPVSTLEGSGASEYTMLMELRIEVPDELAATLRRTPEELEYDLRLRALAGLVERGLLSTGRAAELAGVSRREFLDWCGRWHIRVHRWAEADIENDLAFAQAGARP
jgi:predicted HTH domain antitoxin